MEDPCSPLSWVYYQHKEGLEELKHSLLYTTLELETTILSAQEEIARRERDLFHIKDLLHKTSKERDEAKQKCQKLQLENLVLQNQLRQQEIAPIYGISGNTGEDDEPTRSDKMITIMPTSTNPVGQPPLAADKPLPEKGKLLQAVMEAGPLLQTLLLAGPLPQWQHPPPQLKTIEIPPVTISPSSSPHLLPIHDSCFINKRSLVVPDFSPNKCQRIHH